MVEFTKMENLYMKENIFKVRDIIQINGMHMDMADLIMIMEN